MHFPFAGKGLALPSLAGQFSLGPLKRNASSCPGKVFAPFVNSSFFGKGIHLSPELLIAGKDFALCSCGRMEMSSSYLQKRVVLGSPHSSVPRAGLYDPLRQCSCKAVLEEERGEMIQRLSSEV